MLSHRSQIFLTGLLLAVAALVFAWIAAAASAHVYWSDTSKGAVGRANLDGTVFNPGFVFSPAPPETGPLGIAVSSSHIYWITGEEEESGAPAAIWRANLEGTDTELVLSGAAMGENPAWLAIGGDLLYWASWEGDIHRAHLDGTEPELVLSTGFSGLAGIAVSPSHIYWSRWPNETSSIGRANLDGSEPNESLITGLDATSGLAVDSSHLYWFSYPGRIGRASLDGSERDDDFIPTTGGFGNGLAVSTSHIYFSNGDNPVGSIGQVSLDGSGVNPALITPISQPNGLAVNAGHTDPLPPAPPAPIGIPSNRFRVYRFILNPNRDTAKMMVGVAGPGLVEIAGRMVRRATRRASATQTLEMPVVLKRGAAQKLFENGEIRVRINIAFTPTGGSRNTRSKSWLLRSNASDADRP